MFYQKTNRLLFLTENIESDNQIIGRSSAIKAVRSFVEKAAKSDANVVILGETGVGKELVAKAIHSKSDRSSQELIKLNCANLNENLIESELFGHRKGSFTGASLDRLGLLEAANLGTFFFDEIGDLIPVLQAKLLSVIEDKAIRRIGENKSRRLDVRFIFATNKDLQALMAKGKFREDLFYRISVLELVIPPLRERKKDIPLLIEAILKKERSIHSKTYNLTKDALGKLLDYSFPGNVRELQNILKRACELSETESIREYDVCFHKVQKNHTPSIATKYPIRKILNALIKCGGNKSMAAKELGISRVHLYRLINKSIGK